MENQDMEINMAQEGYKKCPLCSTEVGVKAICSNCQADLTSLKTITGSFELDYVRQRTWKTESLTLGNGFFTIISPMFFGRKEIINFNSIQKFGYKIGYLGADIRFSTNKHLYGFSDIFGKKAFQDFVDFAFQKFPQLKEKAVEITTINILPSVEIAEAPTISIRWLSGESFTLDDNPPSYKTTLSLGNDFFEITSKMFKEIGGKKTIPIVSIKQFGYATDDLYTHIRFVADEHFYTFKIGDKELALKFMAFAFQRFPLLKEKETEFFKIPSGPPKIIPEQFICRNCHIVVSENAQVCPGCSEPLPWIDFICPKCKSTRINAKKIKFGWGTALITHLLCGPILGAYAGTLQIGNIDVTCNNCSHNWIIEPKDVKPYIVDKAKILPIDSAKTGVSGNDSNQIIEQIKKLATLKEEGILTEEEFMKKKEELLKNI